MPIAHIIVGTKEVLYAGDANSAKEEINGLIRLLGFTPVDCGTLRNAREIEDIPVQRFPKWKVPLIISFVVFMVFFLLGFGKFNICFILEPHGPPPPPNTTISNWDLFWKNFETLPITNMNRNLACHALNMLALCYLPGCIAAYIQIWRGTKYSRFPNFLDKWLKMRKQLGLLMLFSACMHVRVLKNWKYKNDNSFDFLRLVCH